MTTEETRDGRCAKHLVQMWMGAGERFCPLCQHQEFELLKAQSAAANEQITQGQDLVKRMQNRIDHLEHRDRIRSDTVTKMSEKLAQEHSALIESQRAANQWVEYAKGLEQDRDYWSSRARAEIDYAEEKAVASGAWTNSQESYRGRQQATNTPDLNALIEGYEAALKSMYWMRAHGVG